MTISGNSKLLIDLKPRWVTLTNWSIPNIFYTGLSFFCPHCNDSLPEHGPNRRQRIAISFWPPIDPDKLLGDMFVLPKPIDAWDRISGDSFETITLKHSINLSTSKHWHGYIKNGICSFE
jgi:hypothetical protein